MKALYHYPVRSVSGSMDKNHYASVNPCDPQGSIIKHKPRHKSGWVKPESMARQNNAYQQAIQAAKRDYHNPTARATWQTDYDVWRHGRQQHGHAIFQPGEPKIRSLWDYIRWQLLLRAYQ